VRPIRQRRNGAISLRYVTVKSCRRLPVAALMMLCAVGCGKGSFSERKALRSLEQLGAQVTLNSEGRAKVVDLSSKPVGDSDLVLLEGLEALEDLDLSGTDVTDAGLVHISDLTSLRKLNVGAGLMKPSNLTDAGLEQLKNLHQLEQLVLSGAKITDDGLAQLAPLKNLQRLYLFQTRITDAGLEHLEGLQNLEILRVGRTAVTQEAAEEFQAKMPKLTRLIEAPPEDHSSESDEEADSEEGSGEETGDEQAASSRSCGPTPSSAVASGVAGGELTGLGRLPRQDRRSAQDRVFAASVRIKPFRQPIDPQNFSTIRR
jgi:hypothetical protein